VTRTASDKTWQRFKLAKSLMMPATTSHHMTKSHNNAALAMLSRI